MRKALSAPHLKKQAFYGDFQRLRAAGALDYVAPELNGLVLERMGIDNKAGIFYACRAH